MCYCKTPLTWVSTANACVINCSKIFASTGANDTLASCLCYSVYTWNLTNFTCDLNCSKVSNTDTSASTAAVGGVCKCIPKFVFNPYIPRCVINCSQFGNSTGINLDTASCKCKSKYNWNSNACQLTGCGTATILNSASLASDGSKCVCQNETTFRFYWAPLTAECKINCTGLPNTLGVLASLSSCRCRNNTIWDATLLDCQIKCATVTNGNGLEVNATACGCNTGYAWDAKTYTCQPTLI